MPIFFVNKWNTYILNWKGRKNSSQIDERQLKMKKKCV